MRPEWVLGALALALGSFTLTLDFAQDDFWLLPTAGAQVRGLALMPWQGAPLPPKPDSPVFQPTLQCAAAVLDAVLPRPWAAWPFHALVITLQALTVMLLYRVLQRRVDARAAFIAAGLFLLLPAGMQAWTWISGSGAVLVLLFTLLAVNRLDRGGVTTGNLLCVSAWTALACMSQRAGMSALPLLMLLSVRAPGDALRWKRLVLIAVFPAVAVILQTCVIGFGYTGGTRMSLAMLPQLLDALPILAADLFAPPFSLSGVAVLDALPRWLWLLPWLVLLCTILSRAPRTLLHSVAVLLLTLLPALAHWALLAPAGQSATGSRTLYLPGAALAFAVAAGLNALHGTARRLALMSLISLAALGIAGLCGRALAEHEVAESVRAWRNRLAALAAQMPAEAPLLIADSLPVQHSLPLISAGFVPDALRPPFTPRAIITSHFPDLTALCGSELLRSDTGPIGVADHESGLDAVLPSMPASMPSWKLTSAEHWRPEAPLPGRMLAALVVHPAPQSELTGIEVRTERGVWQAWARDAGAMESLALGLPEDPALLCSAEILEVRTLGALPLPPQGLIRIPDLQSPVLAPADDAVLTAGEMPAFVVADWPQGCGALLEVRVRRGDFLFAMDYALPAAELVPTGVQGAVSLTPADTRCVRRGHPGFSFEAAGGLIQRELAPFGIREVEVRWRITATAPGSTTPTARSGWRTAQLRLP